MKTMLLGVTILFTAIGLFLDNFSTALAQEKGSDAFTLEEIVVTAQKRTEKLQEATISASVLSDTALTNMNASELTDLNNLVPSLQLKGTFNGRVPMAMRGISTNVSENAIGVTSGVSISIDGVPVPADSMGVNELEDIQRAEVLKGPQSTLGGRAASAGSINIVTKAPSDTFTGSASITATTDKQLRFQGYLSGPITDALKFSLSGNKDKREYPTKNLNVNKHSDSDSKGVRAKVSFEPNDDLSILLTGHISKIESRGGNFAYQYLTPGARLFPFIPYPAPPTMGIPQSDAFPGVNIRYGNTDYNSPVTNSGTKIDDKDLSLNIDYRLGRYTLSSITAYQKENRKNIQDIPAAVVYFFDLLTHGRAPHFSNSQQIDTEPKSFTQELKIVSPAKDPINFVAGLFYSNVTVKANWVRDWVANPVNFTRESGTKNYAAYGRVNWGLTANTKLATGLRFDRDDLSYTAIQRASAGQPAGVIYAPPRAEDTSTAFVGDITLEQNFNPYSMLYLTYARGYKPRAYNTAQTLTSSAPVADPVNQEKINHFELGSKAVYLDGLLMVNAAAFDTIYKDYQVQVWTSKDLIPVLIMQSAGKAETRGVELDITSTPTENMKLTLNAAYIDSKFNEFKNAPAYPTQTDAQGASGAANARLQDLSGKSMPDSPKFKATLGVEQRIFPNSLPFELIVGGQYSYRSEALMLADQNPQSKQPAFGILNLNVKAVSASEKYSLTLFVNNVFDQFYLINAEDFFSALYGPTSNAVIGDPARDSSRYAGVSFKVKF